MEKRSEDVIVWVRLPRAMTIQEMKKAGLTGAKCYGGDTCIAAGSFRPDVDIVVEGSLEALLRKAGLPGRVACFGGDTCIV